MISVKGDEGHGHGKQRCVGVGFYSRVANATAREHYVPRDQRQTSWHPIVIQEMERKEYETSEPNTISYNA